MDQNVGANPFWHTCILLSKYDEQTKKLEVVDNWGYYGLPTTNQQSYLRSLKMMVGLDVDLYGNHGMLRHEEMRYLELGVGLHGVTFEVTEEKFLELQAKCKKMADEQSSAITDAVQPFKLKGKTKSRIYPHESLSPHIYALEQAAAAEQKREPRLKPFSLSFFSPHTCKMQAIHLLDGILTPEQVKRVRGYHQAVSRWSGRQENIYLHSSGPTRQHKKANGEVVHYREASDPGVKLHWTVPPQEIETLSGEVKDLFKVHSDHCDDVRTVVRRLQQLEWLFRNAVFEAVDFGRRDKLVNLIRERYEAFAAIEPKKPHVPLDGWTDKILWILNQARDEDEQRVMSRVASARLLFNALYMAITDPVSSEDEAVAAYADDEDLELLASRLRPEAQKQLCKIIGRSYVDVHDAPEDDVAADDEAVGLAR
jgi:hypothetical protein